MVLRRAFHWPPCFPTHTPRPALVEVAMLLVAVVVVVAVVGVVVENDCVLGNRLSKEDLVSHFRPSSRFRDRFVLLGGFFPG